jgi:hypothetical protein
VKTPRLKGKLKDWDDRFILHGNPGSSILATKFELRILLNKAIRQQGNKAILKFPL